MLPGKHPCNLKERTLLVRPQPTHWTSRTSSPLVSYVAPGLVLISMAVIFHTEHSKYQSYEASCCLRTVHNCTLYIYIYTHIHTHTHTYAGLSRHTITHKGNKGYVGSVWQYSLDPVTARLRCRLCAGRAAHWFVTKFPFQRVFLPRRCISCCIKRAFASAQ
jgi:hypothetical protein